MGTIKDEAKAHKPLQKTKNISELERIPTDLEVQNGEFEFLETNEETGETRTKVAKYQYIEVNGERYKLPVTVKEALQEHFKENPELKHFKVAKSGQGKSTRYTVIPLSN